MVSKPECQSQRLAEFHSPAVTRIMDYLHADHALGNGARQPGGHCASRPPWPPIRLGHRPKPAGDIPAAVGAMLVSLGNPHEFTMPGRAQQVLKLTGAKLRVVHQPLL